MEPECHHLQGPPNRPGPLGTGPIDPCVNPPLIMTDAATRGFSAVMGGGGLQERLSPARLWRHKAGGAGSWCEFLLKYIQYFRTVFRAAPSNRWWPHSEASKKCIVRTLSRDV